MSAKQINWKKIFIYGGIYCLSVVIFTSIMQKWYYKIEGVPGWVDTISMTLIVVFYVLIFAHLIVKQLKAPVLHCVIVGAGISMIYCLLAAIGFSVNNFSYKMIDAIPVLIHMLLGIGIGTMIVKFKNIKVKDQKNGEGKAMETQSKDESITKGMRIFSRIMCVPSAFLVIIGVSNIISLFRHLKEASEFTQGTDFHNYHMGMVGIAIPIIFMGVFAVLALISYIKTAAQKEGWLKKAFISSVLMAAAALICIVKSQFPAIIICIVYAGAAVAFKLSLKAKSRTC